ncbi:PepSY domain-containing protein [Winogradskyella sp.]|uniref:PepSY domain-containing protein n=1 Tax=Winogradskyella sp. TaxID=1883156 RepID=UPI0025FF8E2C|nr:PepSY domain-containing protein [Winogradskyella sp.]
MSIWRYSHYILALSSAVFIFIASVTGIILAFEPITNQSYSYEIREARDLPIEKTITVLSNKYDEVLSLEQDSNNFLKASLVDKNGKSGTYYINPINGDILGKTIQKKPIYEFATNLHRSLFLKSTGRFIIGLVSFLLCLIAISGTVLIAKRQGGFKRWFAPIIKENFEQDYHVKLGRYTLIPIIVITLTGVFLSMERFSILPEEKLQHISSEENFETKRILLQDFEVFNNNTISDLKRLEFPFSKDEEDYYVLRLKNKEVLVNQYSGQVISHASIPLVSSLLDWSIVLHTGRGTVIWSIVLFLSCISILFFMYSGFTMSLRRKQDTKVYKNKVDKDEAEYVILVGSETGNTFTFAKQFAEALNDLRKSVFVDSLDNYKAYKKATDLIVFTSTYGEGDAPSNAKKFESRLANLEQNSIINYSVVGFGSLLYPDFCKYAIVVDGFLQKHNNFIPLLPLFKINNQSFEAFKTWASKWALSKNLDLKIKRPKSKIKSKQLKQFSVVSKTDTNNDDTYIIQLKPNKRLKFQSGDLIAFYPEEDNVERLYSVGKVNDSIVLSIKRHEKGICSNYLNTMNENNIVRARLKRNLDFHFPNYTDEVIMIANGTGIAPFLGMINNNTQGVKTHLFWGGRTQTSLELYSSFIDTAFNKKTLSSFHVAYSKEENEIYVQDLILENQDLFYSALDNGSVIMICGSIAMQNGVLEVLDSITKSKLNKPLSVFENNEQIKMDCY